jgi:ubiquitin carboxyl-terminal hydrolase 14
MMTAWRTALRQGSSDPIQELFGITTRTELSCPESGETVVENVSGMNIKCNITKDVSHLTEGVKLGFAEEREKNSEALGRMSLWTGTAQVVQLPKYLTVQVMRFFYNAATQNRAKILKQVPPPKSPW